PHWGSTWVSSPLSSTSSTTAASGPTASGGCCDISEWTPRFIPTTPRSTGSVRSTGWSSRGVPPEWACRTNWVTAVPTWTSMCRFSESAPDISSWRDSTGARPPRRQSPSSAPHPSPWWMAAGGCSRARQRSRRCGRATTTRSQRRLRDSPSLLTATRAGSKVWRTSRTTASVCSSTPRSTIPSTARGYSRTLLVYANGPAGPA
ncbi:uncharacterized protein METZ01_LOCUS108998, partial [marine metagenome]